MKLNVYYDLQFSPVTFDFSVFLILSNAVRQRLKLKTMAVEILCKNFRNWSDREKEISDDSKRWRVSNILSRLPFLIPEVDSLKINNSNLEEIKLPSFPGGYPPPPGIAYKMPYTANYLKDFYEDDSVNLRPFKSSQGAQNLINHLFQDNVITISLRTTKFQSPRNSNIKEWYKVYNILKKAGFKPIVLPDFEDLMGKKIYANYDWEVFLPASLDIDLRMALYEKAFDNLCINNGPSSLLCFSNCPYKLFKFVTPEVNTATEKAHKEILNISRGENFKFAAKSGQKIIWEPDDSEIITKSLEYI
jgi:hypothetical protein